MGFFFLGSLISRHSWDLAPTATGWRDQLSQGLAASQEEKLAGSSRFCARGWLELFFLCLGMGRNFGSGQVELLRWHLLFQEPGIPLGGKWGKSEVKLQALHPPASGKTLPCWWFPSPGSVFLAIPLRRWLSRKLSLKFFPADKERCEELRKALSTAHEKFCFWPDSPCPGGCLRFLIQHYSLFFFPPLSIVIPVVTLSFSLWDWWNTTGKQHPSGLYPAFPDLWVPLEQLKCFWVVTGKGQGKIGCRGMLKEG